ATLERLAAEHPEDRLFLILGSDALAELARWRRPDQIRDLATLLVAERPGAPAVDRGLGAMTFDAPRLDLSARELRARALAGRSLRYLVPEPVWRYIEERGVYPARETTPRTT
ncbi:MAG: nicotinate-nicotinamide nucleotide adenylyltransferase, partial [Candidatus Limnocylindria bacterium]